MKVETPQILWNSEGDKGLNAALNSIAMLESGLSEHADDETINKNNSNSNNNDNISSNGSNAGTQQYGNVMATAGNTHIINLWKLSFPSSPAATTMTTTASVAATKIKYLCSLARQEQAVNTVAFSPDGLHLATGGETGAILVWSVPPSKRGGGNGRHYWSTVTQENDLTVRVVTRNGEGITDISWSADSKRFVAGTIDHTVLICEDKNYDSNHHRVAGGPAALESDWQSVYRNSMDHTHYVQGVAYDPLGVYLASMGSDRSVRVFPRKTPAKSKKKVLRPSNTGTSSTKMECFPPSEHRRMVDQLLTESKLEVNKSKLIKFRTNRAFVSNTNSSNIDESNANVTANENDNKLNVSESQPKPQRSHLFADESTLESFFRRLAWTTDGAFLITPAALYHPESSSSSSASTEDSSKQKESPSFATYLFARHKFDEPCKVLSGLEKPSVVVRASPVLFKLPGSDDDPSPAEEEPESKENQTPSSGSRRLPYRSVFAVLTTDTILVYDTHHSRPLSVVRGLHYAGLSDCQWSKDGTKLVVSSIDGYVSIVSFDNGELGEVYNRPVLAHSGSMVTSPSSVQSPLQSQNRNNANGGATSTTKPTVLSFSKPKVASNPIPPCEPGQTATIEAPPSKRAKTRITPTLISVPNGSVPAPSSEPAHAKRCANELLEHDADTVGEAVTKLTLSNDEKPKKKKKRIQPLLISAGN